jgi:DNA polymerase-3 subunit epsilon/exodeoxyribonuclease X
MTPASWPRLVVADVEGNGASPPDLVEVAFMPIAAGELCADAARSWLIRPPAPIQTRVARIHGITNTAVQSCPAWGEVIPEVSRSLDGAWIAAHSASVEYNALTRHLPDWQPPGVLDTLRLARATYPDAPRYSLDTLLQYTGIDLSGIPGQRHRAGYDAHATALLLLEMARHYRTWDDLAAAAVPPGYPGEKTEEEASLW